MQPKEPTQPNTNMFRIARKKKKNLPIDGEDSSTNHQNLKQRALREVILLISIIARKVIHPLNVGEGLMLDSINAISLDMKLSFARTRVNNKK